MPDRGKKSSERVIRRVWQLFHNEYRTFPPLGGYQQLYCPAFMDSRPRSLNETAENLMVSQEKNFFIKEPRERRGSFCTPMYPQAISSEPSSWSDQNYLSSDDRSRCHWLLSSQLHLCHSNEWCEFQPPSLCSPGS